MATIYRSSFTLHLRDMPELLLPAPAVPPPSTAYSFRGPNRKNPYPLHHKIPKSVDFDELPDAITPPPSPCPCPRICPSCEERGKTLAEEAALKFPPELRSRRVLYMRKADQAGEWTTATKLARFREKRDGEQEGGWTRADRAKKEKYKGWVSEEWKAFDEWMGWDRRIEILKISFDEVSV